MALSLGAPAVAALSERQLARAVARPAARVRLPAALSFTDQRGGAVTLGEVEAGGPLVLLFADYTCRHVCGPGAALTAGALRDTGLRAGRDYRLAVIGIDPKDDAGTARDFARRIGDAGVLRATWLLRGAPAAVATATRALGYGYAYDAETDQFAHDASVYIFARDGRLVALLPELGLRPAAVRAAIVDGTAPADGFGERVARLCYGLAAAHGRFGRPIVMALQALAALTVLGGALVLWRGRRA